MTINRNLESIIVDKKGQEYKLVEDDRFILHYFEDLYNSNSSINVKDKNNDSFLLKIRNINALFIYTNNNIIIRLHK